MQHNDKPWFDQVEMERVPTVERSLTMMAGFGNTRASVSLSDFAESRAQEGPVYTYHDGGPRDFEREVAEELADARNYCVWALQRNGYSDRVSRALGKIVEAWAALGFEPAELEEDEPVPSLKEMIEQDFEGARQDAEDDAFKTAEFLNSFRRSVAGVVVDEPAKPSEVFNADAPLPYYPTFGFSDEPPFKLKVEYDGNEDPCKGFLVGCCLEGEDDAAAALCMEDRRLEAEEATEEPYRRPNHWEMSLPAQMRLIAIGDRVRTVLQPGDALWAVHGREGKVVEVNRNRLTPEHTHRVVFAGFGPEHGLWFRRDELVRA